jgi:hypothetical protein
MYFLVILVNDLINLQKYSTKLSQVAIQAQQLYTEGIIDIQMLTEVENTGGYFKDSLFDVVCSAMFKDKNVLRKFANVLSKSNSTASLANDIIRDCGELLDNVTDDIKLFPLN